MDLMVPFVRVAMTLVAKCESDGQKDYHNWAIQNAITGVQFGLNARVD
jgi:hypothetical protein